MSSAAGSSKRPSSPLLDPGPANKYSLHSDSIFSGEPLLMMFNIIEKCNCEVNPIGDRAIAGLVLERHRVFLKPTRGCTGLDPSGPDRGLQVEPPIS